MSTKERLLDFVKSLDEAACQAGKTYDRLTGFQQNSHNLTLTFMSRAVPALGMAFAAAAAPVATMGALGFGLVLAGTQFRDNRHKRAAAFMATTAFLAQHGMAGDAGNVSGVIMAALGALRAVTMTVIPDDNIPARKRAAYAFWAVGSTAIAGSAGFMAHNGTLTAVQGLEAVLPAAAMTMGTIADAMPDSKTRYARLCRMIGAAFVSIYDFSLAKVYMTGAANVFGGALLVKAIEQYDVPLTNLNKNPLSLRERFTRYADSLLSGHKADGFTRDELSQMAPKGP